MIDLVPQIITILKSELENVNIKSSFDGTHSKFPIVVVSEVENIINMNTITSDEAKTYNVSFNINIFDIGNKRKENVKLIRDKIDLILNNKYKMNRNTSQEVENYIDNTIYRWLLQYSCVVDNNEKIYRG